MGEARVPEGAEPVREEVMAEGVARWHSAEIGDKLHAPQPGSIYDQWLRCAPGERPAGVRALDDDEALFKLAECVAVILREQKLTLRQRE